MISVLLPSRGHPDLLKRSVASLLDHASAVEMVEVLVAADEDDPETVKAAERHSWDEVADRTLAVYQDALVCSDD